jgi:cellulose synthase/poly-beta-1,6-N-acetylglucosamine synthase-like glycosyltransferase
MEVLLIALYIMAAIVTIFYAKLFRTFRKGWNANAQKESSQPYEAIFLSVIIPFRNEARNLPVLISNLKKQDYPADKVEFLFIDDHSTDSGGDRIHPDDLKPFIHRMIRLNDDSHGSKKEAIAKGVKEAKGNLILTIDADVRVGPKWLASMTEHYHTEGSRLFWGPVMYEARRGFLQGFFRFEFLGLVAAAAASAGAGRPFMSNGANMAFHKGSFQEVNGFEGNMQYRSGDDVFLLHKMKERYGPEQISFNKDKEAVSIVEPPSGLGSFFSQRIRWASKSKGYKDQFARYVTGLVFLESFLLLNCFIALLFYCFAHHSLGEGGFIASSTVTLAKVDPAFWLSGFPAFIPLIVLLILKGIPEWRLMKGFTSFYGIRISPILFWIYQLIYIPYIVIAGILSLFGLFKWK